MESSDYQGSERMALFHSCSWLQSTFHSPQKHHTTGTKLKGRNKETTGVKLWGGGDGGVSGGLEVHINYPLNTDKVPD